jgi:PAS domain-containing protein
LQRFVLQKNIARFEQLLKQQPTGEEARTLQILLLAARRDLAFMDSAARGVAEAGGRAPASGDGFAPNPAVVAHFRAACAGSQKLCLAIDPGPGLHMVDMNEVYVRGSLKSREELVGRPLFEAFPDNPDDPAAEGVSALYESLRTAAASGRPHDMKLIRYDIATPEGDFVERYWRPVNTPIFGDDGELLYILHEVESVTAPVPAAAAK